MTKHMTINVGQRGEIVIPKKVREALGIVPGTEIDIVLRDNHAEIKVPKDDIMERWRNLAKMSKIKIDNYDSNKAYEEMMEEQASVYRR